MVAFRIPFNYYFVLPFVVMTLTTIINSVFINNSIKNHLNDESYNKFTNSERTLVSSKECFRGIIIYMSIIAILILSLMFFGNASTIYFGIATIVGLVISAFVSMFVNTSLWSFWYKKEKDNVLSRRIANEKRKLEAKNNKKSDEKIVV